MVFEHFDPVTEETIVVEGSIYPGEAATRDYPGAGPQALIEKVFWKESGKGLSHETWDRLEDTLYERFLEDGWKEKVERETRKDVELMDEDRDRYF